MKPDLSPDAGYQEAEAALLPALGCDGSPVEVDQEPSAVSPISLNESEAVLVSEDWVPAAPVAQEAPAEIVVESSQEDVVPELTVELHSSPYALNDSLTFAFNRQVEDDLAASLELSFTPEMKGEIHWLEDRRSFRFQPAEDWSRTRYHFEFSSSFKEALSYGEQGYFNPGPRRVLAGRPRRMDNSDVERNLEPLH